MNMISYCYHTTNAAKRRVLKALFDAYPDTLTSLQISQKTGMEYGKVRRLMSHYAASPSHYIRRLKVKGENGAYRFKLNKKGYRYLKEYTMRIKLGVGLGLRKRHKITYMDSYKGHRTVAIKSLKDLEVSVDEIAPYIRIKPKGYEMGVKFEDRLKLVGLITDKEAGKEPDEPQIKRKRGRPRKIALEPSTRKAGDKSLPEQERPLESSVKSPKKSVEKPEKPAKRKVQGKESETKYTVPDLPEELPYPEKEYIFGNEILMSRELAEICVYAINKINRELKRTTDSRQLKKLQDKKRLYLMYTMNDDIKQFIIVRKSKSSNQGQ